MNSYSALLLLLSGISSCEPSNDFPMIEKHIREPSDYSFQLSKLGCSCNDKCVNCSKAPYLLKNIANKSGRQFFNEHLSTKPRRSVVNPIARIPRPTFSLKGRLDRQDNFYKIPQRVTHPYIINRNVKKEINNNLYPFKRKNHYYDSTASLPTMKNEIKYSTNNLISHKNYSVDGITRTTAPAKYITKLIENKIIIDLFDKFKQSLEQFDSIFYQVSFAKLRATNPANRNENGISFVQSGLLLYIALMAISTEVELTTKLEIDESLMYPSSVMEKVKLLKHVIAWLPVSNNDLKFRWASRLALEEGLQVSQGFVGGIANWSKLHVEQFNNTITKDNVFYILNHMVETDSGGAMHDTFIEDDFSEGFCSVFLTTLYIRARWRVAPTVLNNTYTFKDGTLPDRSVRMIKLNDMMGYTQLVDWNAEAIELKYASAGLTLLMVVPRGNSITNLIGYMKTTTPQEISNKMSTVRVAAILPIYTLRMALFLPGKLQMMNISRLMDAKPGNNSKCGELRLSHAVQRLMFWAEAGRYAFKDDGIEWDEAPDVQLTADRPYLFYVRWKNITLMNGNFVL